MHTFGSELSCYDPRTGHWNRNRASPLPGHLLAAAHESRQGVRGAAGRGAARDRAGDAKSVSDTVRVSRRTRELKNTSGGLGGPWGATNIVPR